MLLKLLIQSIRNEINLSSEVRKLKKEIEVLKDCNADMLEEYKEHLIMRYNYRESLASTIRDLYDLSDINNLEISEVEKNKHRNVILEKMKKENLQKIIELDESPNASSSKKLKN